MDLTPVFPGFSHVFLPVLGSVPTPRGVLSGPRPVGADEPAPEPVSGRGEAELQTVLQEVAQQVTRTTLGAAPLTKG